MEPKEELEKMAIARLNSEDPSNRDLADALKVIINRLWSKDDLRDFVTKEQQALCAKCKKARPGVVTPFDKWLMGVCGTLITALCGVIYFFMKGTT